MHGFSGTIILHLDLRSKEIHGQWMVICVDLDWCMV